MLNQCITAFPPSQNSRHIPHRGLFHPLATTQGFIEPPDITKRNPIITILGIIWLSLFKVKYIMIVIALTSPSPPPSPPTIRQEGGGRGCLEAVSGDPNLQDPDLLIHIPVDSRLRSQSLPGYKPTPFSGPPGSFPFILSLSSPGHFPFHPILAHPAQSPFLSQPINPFRSPPLSSFPSPQF